MERVTISIDQDLLAALDALMAKRGYQGRSEAVRDIVRQALAAETISTDDKAPCVATLAYVYDHEKRDLARRLSQSQHHHHDLTVASLHVHLDHSACLEVAVLKGPTDQVKALADEMTTQRGVRYGHLGLVPANIESHTHSHAHAHGPHTHVHVKG